jgi:hypothetical protein
VWWWECSSQVRRSPEAGLWWLRGKRRAKEKVYWGGWGCEGVKA